MRAPLAMKHEWLTAVLRRTLRLLWQTAELPALNGFYREVRRNWLRCLRRRSQKSRRMGRPEFET
ncbi:hypothetical protein [Bradyrhizobium sp. 144]|uniref:hypothetical protein n=1 Tax=Bradyrhizobium sp. 144 TaxID=2782620 RepID=UPI001FF6FDAA|nr:hypothetical protein [Bradyrhizobium sp. 144]